MPHLKGIDWLSRLGATVAVVFAFLGWPVLADLIVSDYKTSVTNTGQIRRFDDAGASKTFPTSTGNIELPGFGEGIACRTTVAGVSELFVATYNAGGNINVYDLSTGQPLRSFTGLNFVGGVSLSPDGKILYVADGARVVALDAMTGVQLYMTAVAIQAHDILVSLDGSSVYVTHFNHPSEVLKFKADLTPAAIPVFISDSTHLTKPGGMAFDADGNLWVSNLFAGASNSVNEYDITGSTGVFLRNVSFPANSNPLGLALGADKNMYVAEFSSLGNPFTGDVAMIELNNKSYVRSIFIPEGSVPGKAGINPKYVSESCNLRPAAAAGDPYQVRCASNLDIGDSFVNFTNGGTLNGADPAGRICVNVYAFDPGEELISCCSCLVTPNGLNSLSVLNDVIANTLTPGKPTSICIKLLASTPVGGTCNPSTPTSATLVRGIDAWGTTLHLNTNTATYQHTEAPFSPAELSPSELTKLTSFCGFIQMTGSGFGICKSCRTGGLGAVGK